MPLRTTISVGEPRVDDVRRVIGNDAPLGWYCPRVRVRVEPEKLDDLREVLRRGQYEERGAGASGLVERHHWSSNSASVFNDFDTECGSSVPRTARLSQSSLLTASR
jgi:hypothetical protein